MPGYTEERKVGDCSCEYIDAKKVTPELYFEYSRQRWPFVAVDAGKRWPALGEWGPEFFRAERFERFPPPAVLTGWPERPPCQFHMDMAKERKWQWKAKEFRAFFKRCNKGYIKASRARKKAGTNGFMMNMEAEGAKAVSISTEVGKIFKLQSGHHLWDKWYGMGIPYMPFLWDFDGKIGDKLGKPGMYADLWDWGIGALPSWLRDAYNKPPGDVDLSPEIDTGGNPAYRGVYGTETKWGARPLAFGAIGFRMPIEMPLGGSTKYHAVISGTKAVYLWPHSVDPRETFLKYGNFPTMNRAILDPWHDMGPFLRDSWGPVQFGGEGWDWEKSGAYATDRGTVLNATQPMECVLEPGDILVNFGHWESEIALAPLITLYDIHTSVDDAVGNMWKRLVESDIEHLLLMYKKLVEDAPDQVEKVLTAFSGRVNHLERNAPHQVMYWEEGSSQWALGRTRLMGFWWEFSADTSVTKKYLEIFQGPDYCPLIDAANGVYVPGRPCQQEYTVPDEEGQYPEEFGGLRPQAWHQDLLDKAEADGDMGDMGDMGEGASGGDVAKEGGAIEVRAAPVGGHNLVELDGYTMRWRPVLKANDDGRTAELAYHPIGGYHADWVAEDEVKSALEDDDGEGEAEDLDLVWEDKKSTQPPQEAEGQGAESGQASAPSSEL